MSQLEIMAQTVVRSTWSYFSIFWRNRWCTWIQIWLHGGKKMVRFGTFISENILHQLGPFSHFETVLPWIKLIKGNYEYVYNLCAMSRCLPMVSSPLWPAGEVKHVSENFHFIQLNKSLTKRTKITQ